MENDTPAPATIALERVYARAAAFEKIMQRAVFVDEHVHDPRYHEMVLQAREAAQRLATCPLSQRPGEDDDDDDHEEGSGVGEIAEFPPGVPAWPPKLFLARTKFFTKGWQKWSLRQDESSRPDSDGRIAEGDAISVILLWMDFAMLSDRLAKESSQFQEHAIADDLRAESSAYMAASYEVGRMRVDDVTM
jgi:hypothetical protein